MKIKMTLQHTDIKSGNTEIQDITDLISSVSYETQISEQPGKLSFECIDDDKITFDEGDVIIFTVDEVGIFYGFVFKYSINESNIISVTAYDQMRYLQNSDIYIISDVTASQVFEMVCQDFEVKRYKVVSPSSLIIPPRIHDNKTLFDIIDYGIGHELRFNKKWYMIRDNFGVLEFVDVSTLATNYVLSNQSNIFKYSFESSIDEDTYNQIKIYQENRINKKGKAVKSGGTVVSRDYGYAKSDASISTWGTLQYCEKSDKGLNQAQLDMYAESIKSQKNRPTRKFTLTAEGNLDVNSGNQIFISVSKVEQKVPDYKKFLITACTHTFSNNEHKMDLTLMLPQYGLELR